MAKTVILKLDQVKCTNENHCLDMTTGSFIGSLDFTTATPQVSGVNVATTNDLASKANSSDVYTKVEVDNNVAQAKTDILGGASTAYDTLQEIEAYITQNNTDVGSLLTNMGTKYDKTGGAISGNVSISGTMSVGSWTMEVVSNELVFKYNGTKVAKIGTNGLITSANDMAAFGTV